MPLKVEKFFSSLDVQAMRWDERGAFLLLLAHSWLNGGKLPAQCERIARVLQVDDADAWQRIEKFVLSKFELSECGQFLINERLMQIYNEVTEATGNRRKLASEAAKKRWSKTQGCKSNAAALPEQCKPNAIQNQNQRQNNNPHKSPIPQKRDVIRFDFDSGSWKGISEDWINKAQEIYPAVEIKLAILQAGQWAKTNPTKRKSNWERFLMNWFSRNQEKGGGAAKRDYTDPMVQQEPNEINLIFSDLDELAGKNV